MNAPAQHDPSTVAYAADAHRLLRGIVARAENRFRESGAHGLGYKPETFARRLAQKLLAEITTPFRRKFKRMCPIGDAGLLAESRFDAGPFTVDGRTGEVSIGIRAVAKWIGVFALYWLYILATACLSLRLRESACPPATLLHGVGHETLMRLGDDASFVDFVHGGPVTVLNASRVLFVQAVRPVRSTRHQDIHYARYPLLALLRRRGLAPGDLAGFLAAHLRAAGAYVRAVTRLSASALLARDFAFDATAAILNRRDAISALVLTGSNFMEQMLWMSDLPDRRYATHMVFYSVNGNPFVYKSHPAYEHNPGLSHIRVDAFWVWTPGQAQMVREWGLDTPCHVVGPILFYRPAAGAAPKGDSLQIVVFDVTPMEPDLIERWGVVHPYYTTAHANEFIRDVIAARDAAAGRLGRRITLALKPKRPYQRVHSTAYIDFLLERIERDPQFRMLDPQTDLEEVIASSDLVITLPYSSPPYIAAPLGVPSIYYDPSDELVPTHETHPLIGFASTPEALERAMTDALRRAAQPPSAQAGTG